MLHSTCEPGIVPGTNLKGQAAGGNWTFLLPRRALEQVVCVGCPSEATLRMLSRIGEHVLVWDGRARQLTAIQQTVQRLQLPNVSTCLPGEDSRIPLADGSVDLIYLARRSWLRRWRRDAQLRGETARLLTAGGMIYFECCGRGLGDDDERALSKLAPEFAAPQTFWLTPRIGETRTAVPAHDGDAQRYALCHGLFSPSISIYTLVQTARWLRRLLPATSSRARSGDRPHRVRQTLPPTERKDRRGRLSRIAARAGHGLAGLLQSAERYLYRQRLLGSWTQRYGVLLRRRPVPASSQLPEYLGQLAREAGLEMSDWSWALSALGNYDSRKVLFYLFEPGQPAPNYILKQVRDPQHNRRLENEHRALSLLWEQGIGRRHIVPEPTFLGHHGNLAVSCQSLIPGRPFRQQAGDPAGCPYTQAALQWLTELAVATADSSVASGSQVAQRLEALWENFVEIYATTSEEQSFLEQQLQRIRESEQAFPLVFQHGDPGTWNLLINPQGQVAFLDWEAADPQGLPLWDLLYFLRSATMPAARVAAGSRGSGETVQPFWGRAAQTRFMVLAIRRYCERIPLAPSLIEPLFYTCWMHRALKEARRLPAERLQQGSYVNLLRCCLAQRNHPAIRQLFSFQMELEKP